MGFKLHVFVGGVCLLAREPEGSPDKRVHVLVPPVKPDHHGKHVHHSVLLYSRAYAPDSPGTDPLVRVPLEHQRLDLSGFRHTTHPAELPWQVYDVEEMVKQKVPRSLIEDDPARKLLSHVILASGQAGKPSPTGRWMLEGIGPRDMSFWMEWMIQVDDDKLDLEFRPITEKAAPPSRTLRPDGGEMRLFIFHSPKDQIMKTVEQRPPVRSKPAYKESAPHFTALCDLFDSPRRCVTPMFVEKGEEKGFRSAIAGLDYNCIIGQGKLEA